MIYRELQQALKNYREMGYTNIKLNSKKAILKAELERCQLLVLSEAEVKGADLPITEIPEINDKLAASLPFKSLQNKELSKVTNSYSDEEINEASTSLNDAFERQHNPIKYHGLDYIEPDDSDLTNPTQDIIIAQIPIDFGDYLDTIDDDPYFDGYRGNQPITTQKISKIWHLAKNSIKWGLDGCRPMTVRDC